MVPDRFAGTSDPYSVVKWSYASDDVNTSAKSMYNYNGANLLVGGSYYHPDDLQYVPAIYFFSKTDGYWTFDQISRVNFRPFIQSGQSYIQVQKFIVDGTTVHIGAIYPSNHIILDLYVFNSPVFLVSN